MAKLTTSLTLYHAARAESVQELVENLKGAVDAMKAIGDVDGIELGTLEDYLTVAEELNTVYAEIINAEIKTRDDSIMAEYRRSV